MVFSFPILELVLRKPSERLFLASSCTSKLLHSRSTDGGSNVSLKMHIVIRGYDFKDVLD